MQQHNPYGLILSNTGLFSPTRAYCLQKQAIEKKPQRKIGQFRTDRPAEWWGYRELGLVVQCSIRSSGSVQDNGTCRVAAAFASEF
jgi:hypothetical protein